MHRFSSTRDNFCRLASFDRFQISHYSRIPCSRCQRKLPNSITWMMSNVSNTIALFTRVKLIKKKIMNSADFGLNAQCWTHQSNCQIYFDGSKLLTGALEKLTLRKDFPDSKSNFKWPIFNDRSFQELTPVEFACETMENVAKELYELIEQYRADPKRNINPFTMRLQGIIDANVMGMYIFHTMFCGSY